MTGPFLRDVGQCSSENPTGSLQRTVRVIVFGLLLPGQWLLLGWLACCTSPTSDEVAHMAAGVRIWQQQRFDLYPVNPPLVKLVATLPVVLDAPVEDWRHLDTTPGTRPEWIVGADFLRANTPRFRWDFVMARWMCLPFCSLGLIYCYLWSESLWGPMGGLLSAILWSFSPMILGNGALITPDVPAAALGVATLFYFRAWWNNPRWSNVFLTGIFLGLAQLTKMTWLILYGLLPALWIGLEWIRQEPRGWPRRGIQLFVLGVISLDLLNTGYLFEGSLRPLKSCSFVSRTFSGSSSGEAGNRFEHSWLGNVPVPIPTAYLAGLDLQRRDFENEGVRLPSYLRGEIRSHGWWYYYLYGLLVKVPLGIWLIAVCGLWVTGIRLRAFNSVSSAFRHMGVRIHGKKHGLGPEQRALASVRALSELFLLLIPPLVVLIVVSSQTGFSRYVRYVLPIFPFLMIVLGGVWSESGTKHWQRSLAGLGLLCFMIESSLVYPHSLSFFNALAGGPARGHWHLLDSNIDWGQDLYFFKNWIQEHPEAHPLFLAYSGVVDPQLAGIPAEPVSADWLNGAGQLREGWYAISVNHLHGYDSAPPVCRRFLREQPVDRAGYSIFIYHIAEERP